MQRHFFPNSKSKLQSYEDGQLWNHAGECEDIWPQKWNANPNLTCISPIIPNPFGLVKAKKSLRSRYPSCTSSLCKPNKFLIRTTCSLVPELPLTETSDVAQLSGERENQRTTSSIWAGPSATIDIRTGSRMLADKGHLADGCGGAYLQNYRDKWDHWFKRHQVLLLSLQCSSSWYSRNGSLFKTLPATLVP